MSKISAEEFAEKIAPLMPFTAYRVSNLCLFDTISITTLNAMIAHMDDTQDYERTRLETLVGYMTMHNLDEIDIYPMEELYQEYRNWYFNGVIDTSRLGEIKEACKFNHEDIFNLLAGEFCFEAGIDLKDLDEETSDILPTCLWALKSGYDLACFLHAFSSLSTGWQRYIHSIVNKSEGPKPSL